jgi:hypothetical protein
MTTARLFRSGVKRTLHVPFCSGGRGREALAYHNLADRPIVSLTRYPLAKLGPGFELVFQKG